MTKKSFIKLLGLLLVVGLLFAALPTGRAQAEGATVIPVYVLSPSWDAEGGGGVFSAYVAPPDYGYVSPGSTGLYQGREAGIIKAGLAPDPEDSHYWDEGLFGFIPNVSIETLAAGPLTYDVIVQAGVNPVWMTIELDTGSVGDRSDNTTYQFVPTSNPAEWHTVDAKAGQWQKWNNNNGDTSGSPLITLSQVATAHPGVNVVRVYLRLGMGDSYNNGGTGTINWVDSATICTNVYDFQVKDWYVAPGGDDDNLGTLDSPFLTIQHAIDVSSDGDTIHVAAGTYNEAAYDWVDLEINKSLSLIGSGSNQTIVQLREQIPGATHRDGVWLSAPNITIQGFTFTKATGATYASAFNIRPYNSANFGTITLRDVVSEYAYNYNFAIDYTSTYGDLVLDHVSMGYAGEKNLYVAPGRTIEDLTVTNSSFHHAGVPSKIASDNSGFVFQGNLTGSVSFEDVEVYANDFNGIYFLNVNGPANKLKDLKVYDNGRRGLNFNSSSNFTFLGTNEFYSNGALYPSDGAAINIKTGAHDIQISNSYIHGNVRGVLIDNVTPLTNISLYHNQMVGNTNQVSNASTLTFNSEANWWGSILGPTAGSLTGSVDFDPWCGDAACSFLVSATEPAVSGFYVQDGKLLLKGSINVTGGIVINEPLYILLRDGTVIQNSSPCFIVNSSNVHIDTESIGGAKCVPTNGANGIDVASALNTITIEGIEFDGTGQDTGDGIHFAGAVSDIVLVDNYMHDLDGDGIEFAGDVSEVVNIQGNMFKANGGLGINNLGANTVGAEYNSWGDVAGPTGTNGDGVSAKVTYEPFTHADLYLVSSGIPWANQVVKGQNITYTVMAHLVNVNAADFVLTYPAELTYVSSTVSGSMGTESVLHNAAARMLQYIGYNTANLTGDLPLFTVTFTGSTAVANAPLSFSYATTSGFGMVGYESSNNVFVNEMVNGSVTIIDLPTISSTDIQGYYLTGEPRDFHVSVSNPSTGGNFVDSIYYVFTIENAILDDLNSLTCKFDGITDTDIKAAMIEQSGNLIGRVGWGSAGFPMAPGFSTTTTCTANFNKAGSYAFTVDMVDKASTPEDFELATLSQTANVYDKPTVTYTSDPYFIIGESGNFAVTITNPATGKYYDNTVVFDVILQNHLVADISAISCTDGTTTWDLLSSLTQDGTNVKARIGGLDGFFTIPAPLTVTLPCTVTYATAGTYTTSTSMVDVVSPLPDRIVSADIPGTATVYAKPVITATNLGGPFDAGVPEIVSLSIANTDIPEPFEIVFDYPAGTVIVYGSNTYTCAVTCPAIPVDLTAEPTILSFTVTFDEAWTGNVGVSLYDSDWTPADRLLASASATGVIVNGNFAVTGTFSMQGNASRAGIPVTLTWGGTFATYGPSATTSAAISDNFSLTVLYGGEYTITTLQPRYLNVTADLLKKITLSGPYNMTGLILKGGNAYWKSSLTTLDNVINTSDASLVGGQYGTAGTETDIGNHGDCNFDSIVNIQDLALVGGNWSLTSVTAYSSTLPWLP